MSRSFALIGVGNMGRGIARNLLINKRSPTLLKELILYDTQETLPKKLLDEIPRHERTIRVEITNNPKDILSVADVVALSLTSEDICNEVLFGSSFGIVPTYANKNPTNPSRKVIIDHGTFTKFFAERTAHQVEAGVKYIDAPVSGGPQGAYNGSLSVMLGGKEEIINEVKPIMELYSAKQAHFGLVGSGMAAKLVNQALVGIHAQAACEAIYLSEVLGIENTQALRELLAVSWGQSKILDLVMADYIAAKNNVQGNNVSGTTENHFLHLKKTVDTLCKVQSAAPLKNLDKDFSCIAKEIEENSDHSNVSNQESECRLPLTNATRFAIEAACSPSHNLQNAPFASLLKLL